MVRGTRGRLAAAVTALAAVVAVTLGGASAANAAPKPPPAPTTVKIAGPQLPGLLVVEQKARPKLFAALINEVSWLANAAPETAPPKADKLGPKYVVSVYLNSKLTQVYDLFPTAAGGPRAHRPSAQPGHTAVDGWFYGRLTMSETLRVSGVPLAAKPDVVGGGVGGGVGTDIQAADPDPVAGMNNFLDQARRLLLLNGAVLVTVLFGLAGVAFMIRRRV
jgi:hypothetical protein